MIDATARPIGIGDRVIVPMVVVNVRGNAVFLQNTSVVGARETFVMDGRFTLRANNGDANTLTNLPGL